ncbi:1-acyl-sn-glycerol-3-phosphate acyltransferase [Sinimarinibacterium sp. NLF-5-8]|uniref:lysophospholipid acyltransferase family protein n=1 Tax=Sinimarinibacterium sp. NLF-5-8 TaxID=2698684 RepID=UPI00137BDE27|nr:lysophospholipid acyltransferase family protein [Sinimarinibacterium sp. NLF-5-8]QHS09746.1 1-acyl-sn-glycerol-3-phosphate acyltransferase [Sinimarinibacterium sp. NLF-5-8]
MTRRLFDSIYAPLAAALLAVATLITCIVVIIGPTLAIRRELGRFGVRLMLACIGVPLVVRGRAHLPSGGCIAVANHASYIDGLVLTAALPREFTFVVQNGAAQWPIIGLTLRRMGVMFVDRASPKQSAQLTRQLMRRLKNHQPIAIFPEGTFKSEPGVLRFKDGAFVMAARTQTPVIPIGIRGTRLLYGGGRKLPRWSPVVVHMDAPIMAEGSDHAAAQILRDRARAQVIILCAEADRDTATAENQTNAPPESAS